MTTAVAQRAPQALISPDTLSALEELAKTQVNALANPSKGDVFGPAFQTASAIATMRQLLTSEVMGPIMSLQGSRLGFRTDRDKERNKDGSVGYPIEIVKDCLIEAVMVGARPSGNEFNIIAGNTYLTKEFFTRILREWPGLTDLVLEFATPDQGKYGALVESRATWKIGGVLDELWFRKTEVSDNRICVRVNSGMGADAILGKAERKLRAKIWQRLTGSDSSIDGDVDDFSMPVKTIGNRTVDIPDEEKPAPRKPATVPIPDEQPPKPPVKPATVRDQPQAQGTTFDREVLDDLFEAIDRFGTVLELRVHTQKALDAFNSKKISQADYKAVSEAIRARITEISQSR